jgi:uncharacterized protein (TIGR02117 family)
MEKMILKKIIKRFIILMIAIISSITLYFTTAFLLTLFPTKPKNSNQNQIIYLIYNDMHSDIVLELNATNTDWKKYLSPLLQYKNGYLSFGWGDKETYINTPTWNELSISTTLKALFVNTPSLMHVSHISDINDYQAIKKIHISKEQLTALEKNILKSFDLNADKNYKAYSHDDLFYPSNYKYNLFNTCNTWTGETLREANISMSYWTPLSQNVIDSLP